MAAIAGLQRAAGNATVERALLQRAGEPAEGELAALQVQGNSWVVEIHFAGVPLPQAPPNGLGAIGARSEEAGRGPPIGWTGTCNSAAFTPPTLMTTKSFRRKGYTVEHYAEVQPTTSQDVTHQSFYVAPGNHLFARNGSTTEVHRSKRYTRLLQVSQEMSELVKAGEQEHLSDAYQAYALTFKLVADKINELAGQRFGPAPNPHEADNLAFAELGRRLPPALGTHYSDWASMFDTLRRMTNLRDLRDWHSLDLAAPIFRGRNVIYPLIRAASTRIGQIPSEELINYPS